MNATAATSQLHQSEVINIKLNMEYNFGLRDLCVR